MTFRCMLSQLMVVRVVLKTKRCRLILVVGPFMQIFEKVLDEERFYVNLHFGAENDYDFYQKAIRRLKRDGLLPE